MGYERKIIIHIGINADSSKEANEKIKEVGEDFEAKFKTYLDQYPHWITHD